jgi:hypothetical protein
LDFLPGFVTGGDGHNITQLVSKLNRFEFSTDGMFEFSQDGMPFSLPSRQLSVFDQKGRNIDLI